VALAADPRCADAGQPEQFVVPDQQDQPVTRAPVALSGAGLRHRETAARHRLDEKLAGPAKLPHGAFSLEIFCLGVLLAPWRT
jgi:hypothetical protein